MTEGEIVQPGRRDVLRRDGIIGRIRLQVAVQHHEIHPLRVTHGKAAQQGGRLHGGEARTVNIAVQRVQMDAFNLVFGKNMDIFAPILRQVGRTARHEIVVAGRDEDRRVQRGEERLERVERVAVDPCAVEQVARQQHEVAPMALFGKPGKRLPLFGAALHRQLRRQRGKRGVQMQVCRVQELNHSASPFPFSGTARWRRRP